MTEGYCSGRRSCRSHGHTWGRCLCLLLLVHRGTEWRVLERWWLPIVSWLLLLSGMTRGSARDMPETQISFLENSAASKISPAATERKRQRSTEFFLSSSRPWLADLLLALMKSSWPLLLFTLGSSRHLGKKPEYNWRGTFRFPLRRSTALMTSPFREREREREREIYRGIPILRRSTENLNGFIYSLSAINEDKKRF